MHVPIRDYVMDSKILVRAAIATRLKCERAPLCWLTMVCHACSATVFPGAIMNEAALAIQASRFMLLLPHIDMIPHILTYYQQAVVNS